MRILHTSDWHLGKRLFKLDRGEEHRLFLNWLIETILREEINLLVIAGDIFDSPNPPHLSLEVFYNFLHRVSIETKTETFIIAGNHDSGPLLEAPSRLLAPHRVKVWGKLSPNPHDHWCTHHDIEVCALPFFRSHELLPQGIGDPLTALKTYLDRPKTQPQLLILHHLAGVFEESGSEQVISLSGVDSIPTDILKKFDYVALGHIHKPQRVADHVYYSGSPIPLRFSETLKKSVVIIEKNEQSLVPRLLNIPSFRDLITIKTNEKDYVRELEKIVPKSTLKPMVEVQIHLTSPVTGLVDEIKSILDKKGCELLSFIPLYFPETIKKEKSNQLFRMSTLELFDEFYKAKYPEADSVPDELKKDFSTLVEKVKNATPTS